MTTATAKSEETSLREKLEQFLKYAILAPSSHNTQPWLFKIVGEDTIEVYADDSRWLKIADSLGVEEQRVNVIADFEDSPPPRLGDNYRVDMRVVLWEGDDILRVPSSALFRQGEDWYVFLKEGSRARLRRVEIGNQSPSFAQVLDGLGEGDAVILHPPNSVAEGTRVTAN